MSMLHPYHDRGRLKWMGFFLSEHTMQLAEAEKEELHIIEPKPEMSVQEINEKLTQAITKSWTVAIQLNDVVDDKYLPDVVGLINGHDELGLFVGSEYVMYEDIRNVEFYAEKKWFDVN